MSSSRFEKALRAWHGSHHDFDQFEDRAIGTGEGTKAMGGYGVYGHGHYVAEERKVAERYRDNLHTRYNARDQSPMFKGLKASRVYKAMDGYNADTRHIEFRKSQIAELPDTDEGKSLRDQYQKIIDHREQNRIEQESLLDSVFPEFLKQDASTREHIQDLFGQADTDNPLDGYSTRLNVLREGAGYDYGSEFRAALEKAHEVMLPQLKHFQIHETREGRLYELNLNLEPHELLDWEAPLDEHHDDAVRKITSVPEVEAAMSPFFDDSVEDEPEQPDLHPEYSTGEEIYKHLVKETGSAVKASSRLLEHGIKGIRYKDAGSRGDTEKPTYNYVIFDPQAIKIMKKLGLKGEVVKDFTDTGVHVKTAAGHPGD